MTTQDSQNQSNLQAKVDLLKCLRNACDSEKDIELISLATTDGFNVGFSSNQKKDIPFDKMAALASSLSALSESTAIQLDGDRYTTTIVESEKRHILLTRASYQKQDCVLTMVTACELPLATARYKVLQLSKRISAI